MQLEQLVAAVRGRVEQLLRGTCAASSLYCVGDVDQVYFMLRLVVRVLLTNFMPIRSMTPLNSSHCPAGMVQTAGTTPSFSFICSMQS